MKNQLLEWKSKYGAVYQLTLEEDCPVYYRTLNGWEIQSVLELQNTNKAKVDIEMAILILAIIHPTPLPKFKKPGTVSALSTEIWKKSFPTEDALPKLAEETREWASRTLKSNFSLALSSIMCKVLPSLDLSNLMDLPLSKLLKLGAIVEEITGTSLLLNDSQGGPSPKGNIKEGYGLTQEQADDASSALSSALKHLKTQK